MIPGVTLTAVTTIVGALLAVGIGFLDAKTGASLGANADLLLLGAGLGALLGVNPLAVART